MTRTALLACFLVALFEGLDIQSMGVAAPRLAADLGFGAGQMGALMSVSSVGLLFGAAFGGWLSDRVGRKAVLMGAMGVLGIFSLATATTTGFEALLTFRLCAGLGLGGAFPNLIAITADVASPARRTTALSLIYCGLPAGGMVAGTLGDAIGAWQAVFLVGGGGPLLLVPLLAIMLPRHVRAPTTSSIASATPEVLFGAHWARTLLLWLSYFLTLWVIYSLLNWLPSMMASRGIAKGQTGIFAVLLNFGAVLGSLALGWAADRQPRGRVLLATYFGMAASLIGLAIATGGLLSFIVFITGFFVIGGQLVLYALAPVVYPAVIRGTGVGAAVAAGRLGSIFGPVAVGFALSHGVGPHVVPLWALPMLVAALVAALLVSRACAERQAAPGG